MNTKDNFERKKTQREAKKTTKHKKDDFERKEYFKKMQKDDLKEQKRQKRGF